MRSIGGLLARCAGASLVAGVVGTGAGCSIGYIIGGMAQSAQREGSTTFDAEYTGLEGFSFAVIVTADRGVQSEFPALLPTMTQRLDLNLAENAGASGHVPGDDVTGFLANNPQWIAWPRARLAEELGVDRLVFVEVNEFRTNEPGNEYVWDGLAWGTVSVIESGMATTDLEAFRKDLRVKFPDDAGFSPLDISKQAVASELLRRLTERSAWLFYTHDEPNSLEY
jgi:hypothetical protein